MCSAMFKRVLWTVEAVSVVVVAFVLAALSGEPDTALNSSPLPSTSVTSSTSALPATTSTTATSTTSTTVPATSTTSTTTVPVLSDVELCDIAVYLDVVDPVRSPEHWRPCIAAAGDWPVDEVMSVMWKESGAYSAAFNTVWPHATGLMQISADNLYDTVYPDTSEVRALRDVNRIDTYWSARDALLDPRVNLAAAYETWKFNGWVSWQCKPDRSTPGCRQPGWEASG